MRPLTVLVLVGILLLAWPRGGEAVVAFDAARVIGVP